MNVTIIGGGLAGCEAAFQLLKRGHSVELCEMRPAVMTPAHKTGGLAELVCSNSLKSVDEATSSGLLKAEMEMLDSFVLMCAKKCAVPAGGALAVDRELFSKAIEEELSKFQNLTIKREEILAVPKHTPVIVATGPLTSLALSDFIADVTGKERLFFFDAAAPIVSAESIDMKKAYFGGRYQKGGNDYLNCPLNKAEYETFLHALKTAETVQLKDFEGTEVFEGCMPVEVMAKRGDDALRFGPMRPVGLTDVDGNRAYAVLQLRKENAAGDLFNLVGFQTNLTFSEQRRVFSLIPALKNAEFLRYGVMHRNTFLNSPEILEATFRFKDGIDFNKSKKDANSPAKDTKTYFKHPVYAAGQISGVEGYVESAMSGLLAAINLSRELDGKGILLPPETSLCGALSRYVAAENKNFQPMNSNFGLLPPLRVKGKKERYQAYAARSLADMEAYVEELSK